MIYLKTSLSPLRSCKDPNQTFVAYKLWVKRGTKWESPYFPNHKPKMIPRTGKKLVVKSIDPRVEEPCGEGINLGTLRWIKKSDRYRYKEWFDGGIRNIQIREIRFKRAHAIIPRYSWGKFRVREAVVGNRVEIQETRKKT